MWWRNVLAPCTVRATHRVSSVQANFTLTITNFPRGYKEGLNGMCFILHESHEGISSGMLAQSIGTDAQCIVQVSLIRAAAVADVDAYCHHDQSEKVQQIHGTTMLEQQL